LIVRNDSIDLKNPDSPWERVFPAFTKQISGYTEQKLIDVLTCDFSTSSIITRTASEITLMEAMESYFEFIVIRIICGIPEITLQGNTGD
jgi:hypothetical protein